MSETVFSGKIEGRVLELRFALAGKLGFFSKKRGDFVRKGEVIAGLEKKVFQTELDQELEDYERKRAEFEIYSLQKGEPENELAKYLKRIKQAELNISVKAVELAKAKLDQADLIAPVDGLIINDSELVPGIYLTPASNPIRILESNSYFFEIEISPENYPYFLQEKQLTVRFLGVEKSYQGKSLPMIPSMDKLRVEIALEDQSNLSLGLVGEARIV